MFSLCCVVSWRCIVVFETCKVKIVLNFISRHSSIVLHSILPMFSAIQPEQTNAKQKIFLYCEKSFHHCVYILSRNREIQLCILIKQYIKSHRKKNTATPSQYYREPAENSLFLNFNELIFCIFIKNLY